MLTKFELCGFLRMPSNTLKDYIFLMMMSCEAMPNSFLGHYELSAKMTFSTIFQSPSPSLKAMFLFRAINTGIFFKLFHNNNLSKQCFPKYAFFRQTIALLAGWNCSLKANICAARLGTKVKKSFKSKSSQTGGFSR